MSNKQKLPEHITAHEAAQQVEVRSIVLRNKVTGKCAYTYIDEPGDVDNALEFLEDGGGFDYEPCYVGKQIVF